MSHRRRFKQSISLKDRSMIALDLADEQEALALARRLAERTGRTVTVRNADGEILDTVKAAARN